MTQVPAHRLRDFKRSTGNQLQAPVNLRGLVEELMVPSHASLATNYSGNNLFFFFFFFSFVIRSI